MFANNTGSTPEERARPIDPAEEHPARKWLPRVVGFAVLAGVIVLVTHFSEERAFLRLASDAKPSWLSVALLLQAATYLAQGEIWRTVGRVCGTDLPLALVYELAVAKLFVDESLPSAGVSGTAVVANVLEEHALPRRVVLAGVVINTTSFFIAYGIALTAAIAVLFHFHQTNALIVLPMSLFVFISGALVAAVIALAGTEIQRGPQWLFQRRIVKNALDVLRDVDAGMVRDVRLQVIASSCQFATFLLDATTLWTLIRALGASADISYVFASFMVANLVQTLSFIPGGLGTFEGAAVLMLKSGHVSSAIALSAVLLFRGVEYFLPMIPGLWFSRRLVANEPRDLPESRSK